MAIAKVVDGKSMTRDCKPIRRLQHVMSVELFLIIEGFAVRGVSKLSYAVRETSHGQRRYRAYLAAKRNGTLVAPSLSRRLG